MFLQQCFLPVLLTAATLSDIIFHKIKHIFLLFPTVFIIRYMVINTCGKNKDAK